MILEVANVTQRFGGLTAVDNVSFQIDEGSITALIGPNGAGKTTLFGAISGFLRPQSGGIRFRGQPIMGLAPHRIARAGMARTFQIVQPFAQLSVRENIAIGSHLHVKSRRTALDHAAAVAKTTGLADRLDRPADSLTLAGRKRLELARALATAPKLILLDEVMAGLVPGEVAETVEIIRQVRDTGVTVMLVEHIMQAVNSLAERCFVLCDGAMIAAGTPAEIAADPAVVDAYLGAGAAERLGSARAHG